MSPNLQSPDNFYLPFVAQVQKSVQTTTVDQEVQRLLDGAAADEVHAKIPRPIRTKDGIFFSGHALSQETAGFAEDLIRNGARIFDPACGAGDLLIAAAKLLPLEDSLSNTLDAWGERLGGTDLHEAFVNAAKWRLALLAKNRHGLLTENTDIKASNLFKNIQQIDYLSSPSISREFDCILVNPPFGHRNAEINCTWSTGKTQLAAIFLEAVINHRKEGQVVIAVLPDVLRGGTRYQRWRDEISKRASTTKTKIYGRFEKRTDVDVFINRYEIHSTPNTDTSSTAVLRCNATVDDFFLIRVGSVVPHRHKGDKGSWKPYLRVSNAPANAETEISTHRRFNGSCFKTPFLAIRRTSNPSDKQRIICTVVTAPELVAVENHLIVALPKNQSLEDCRKLAKILGNQTTTDHINDQIRCRHLTTAALKSVPLHNWES